MQSPRAAISRVEERYTWRLYAQRMMTLSRIYGFWKYVTNLETRGNPALPGDVPHAAVQTDGALK
jgi:hypothetical protein